MPISGVDFGAVQNFDFILRFTLAGLVVVAVMTAAAVGLFLLFRHHSVGNE